MLTLAYLRSCLTLTHQLPNAMPCLLRMYYHTITSDMMTMTSTPIRSVQQTYFCNLISVLHKRLLLSVKVRCRDSDSKFVDDCNHFTRDCSISTKLSFFWLVQPSYQTQSYYYWILCHRHACSAFFFPNRVDNGRINSLVWISPMQHVYWCKLQI